MRRSIDADTVNFNDVYEDIEAGGERREFALELMMALFALEHPEALFAVAQWSLDGEMGMILSVDEAIDALKKAADVRHSAATRNLAIMLESGEHMEADAEAAFENYLLAAVRDDSDALEDAGRMLTEDLVSVSPAEIGKILLQEFDRIETE